MSSPSESCEAKFGDREQTLAQLYHSPSAEEKSGKIKIALLNLLLSCCSLLGLQIRRVAGWLPKSLGDVAERIPHEPERDENPEEVEEGEVKPLVEPVVGSERV